MRDDIVNGLLLNVLEGINPDVLDDYRRYFQIMARYKYDDYQQFSTGMRFLERFALWLHQFKKEDRMAALEFVKEKLIFVSTEEMNLLVDSCFPDLIRGELISRVAEQNKIPDYKVKAIVSTIEYRLMLRQSLFCGLSDGARIEYFRRANTGQITHEQVYQTYELSDQRAQKMAGELEEDMLKILGRPVVEGEAKFKSLFLIDDFSASGTSYLKYDTKENKLKGKIAALYENIFSEKNEQLKKVFDLEDLKIYVVLYLCTKQARDKIESNLDKLYDKYQNRPVILCMHELSADFMVTSSDGAIFQICESDKYYDKDCLEDKHTREGGGNVKFGFGNCALPLVLSHNTPNNSLSILWSYDESQVFVGLFQRIPRHREL